MTSNDVKRSLPAPHGWRIRKRCIHLYLSTFPDAIVVGRDDLDELHSDFRLGDVTEDINIHMKGKRL